MVVVTGLGAAGWAGDSVRLTYLPSGAMPKMGGYMPQRIELAAEKPAGVTKAPDATSPLWGVIEMGPGPTKFVVLVDEPDGQPAKMYFDANGNGDLTDDGATEWNPRSSGGAGGAPALTMWLGGATAKIPYGQGVPVLDAHLGMYRFDKNDTERPQLRNTLLYYGDYGYEGEVTLGEASYRAMLTDDFAKGDFRGAEGERSGVRLLIDVNANGRFDSRGESFDVRKPFNIKGVTYEVSGMSPSGAEFGLGVGATPVAEVQPPPDLSVGQKAPAFEGKTVDAETVKFPGQFAGKVVMLDFWATWCGPCREEIPNVVAAYEKYHGKGFEVLGVTLDQKDKAEAVKSFAKDNHMPWQQVYDGGYWQAAVAVQYGIESIPRAMLVDGDTGEILADGDSIRGDGLAPAIEAALQKKAGTH
jgi:thiol-disulfide isomerase/thioredoxin